MSINYLKVEYQGVGISEELDADIKAVAVKHGFKAEDWNSGVLLTTGLRDVVFGKYDATELPGTPIADIDPAWIPPSTPA